MNRESESRPGSRPAGTPVIAKFPQEDNPSP